MTISTGRSQYCCVSNPRKNKGGPVFYLTGSREEDRLETAFAEEPTFRADLPVQRARLRRIDADAADYLLTRDAQWLSRRGRAVADFREAQERLGRRFAEEPEAGQRRELGGQRPNS